MNYFNKKQEKTLIELIQNQSKDNSQAIISGVKREANRPSNLGRDGALRRDYYKGRYKVHFDAFLQRLYPHSQQVTSDHAAEIHPVTTNDVRTWAITAADIYRNGEPVRSAQDEKATKRLRDLCEQAETSTVLPDSEVKAIAAKQMFLRCLRNSKTDKLELSAIWPCDVYAVTSPSAPRHLEHSSVVGLQITPEVLEVWSSGEDKKGTYWKATQYSSEKGVPPIDVFESNYKYRGQLPIFSLNTSEPENSPYIDDGDDLIDLANNMMLSRTELMHCVRMQGHSAVWVKTDEDVIQLNGGPAGINKLGSQDEMGALHMSPALDEQRKLLNDFKGDAARSHSQSAYSYSNRDQPLNSGVALRVENKINEEIRPQRVSLMRRFEKNYLLRILDEVDTFLPAKRIENVIQKAKIEWSEVTVDYPRSPIVEDVSQRQLRLAQAVKEGWITPERAAVEAGYYQTTENASLIMDVLKIEKAAQEKEVEESKARIVGHRLPHDPWTSLEPEKKKTDKEG